MTKYDKLVRDRIPEILDSKNLSYDVVTVSENKLKCYIQSKFVEEVDEFLRNPCLDELADIQEVIFGALNAYNWSQEDLDKHVLHKREKRGSFLKGFILREVNASVGE